jgi:hypothetical protein
MTGNEALHRIAEQGIAPDYSVAEYLRYHGEGHFHVWEVRLEAQEGTFIAKSPTHEDERRLLFRDLAVARVGALFNPSITPYAGLAEVPSNVAKPERCEADRQGEPPCNRPVAAHQVFATQRLGRAYKGTLANLDEESLARIAAFCCWVDATDSEYVDGQDGRAYSIDHADSLSGAARWREGSDPGVKFGDLARLDDGRLRNPKLYERFLEELRHLTEDAIVGAFAGIPPEWKASAEDRAHEALYLLARRALVGDAVREYT